MDRNSFIALFLLYRRRKRRRDRLRWVLPGRERKKERKKEKEFGAFYTLFGKLRDDANRFLNYFRMSVSSFDEMHRRLKESLHSTCRNVGCCNQVSNVYVCFKRRI